MFDRLKGNLIEAFCNAADKTINVIISALQETPQERMSNHAKILLGTKRAADFMHTPNEALLGDNRPPYNILKEEGSVAWDKVFEGLIHERDIVSPTEFKSELKT